MGNVLQFKPKSDVQPPAPRKSPKNTRIPEDANVHLLTDVLLTVAWASYTGNLRMADKLTNFVKANNYAHWLALPADLEAVLYEADLELGFAGPPPSGE